VSARVPDGVAGAHADPLGDGPVLLLLLAQDLLDLEGLLGRLLAQATADGGDRCERGAYVLWWLHVHGAGGRDGT